MNKIKVLHVSDEMSGGGAESVFRDTIKASQENGDQVDFFVSEKRRSIFSYVFSLRNFFLIKKRLNSFKPNVIHLHNYYHYLTPSILLAIRRHKKRYNCKVILTAHDYHLICPNSGFQFYKDNLAINYNNKYDNISYSDRFDVRSLMHSVLKLSQHVLCYDILKLNHVFDKIICPSEFLRDTFENYNVMTKKVIIRNPFNIEINNEKNSRISESNNVTSYPGVIAIVYFGRLSPEKGIMEFIDGLNNISINVDFHIYGSGGIKNDISNIKCRTGLNVIIHEFIDRDELIKKIKLYDIFSLPSVWFENAPNSIIEAGAAGLPVIVSNRGGMIEMAKQTLFHYLLDDHAKNLENIIVSAYGRRKMNCIKEPNNFSYLTYKNAIFDIYRS